MAHQHSAMIFKPSCFPECYRAAALLPQNRLYQLILLYPSMIPNAWSKGLYCSNNFCLEGCTVEQLSSFNLNPMPSSVSDVFFSCSKDASSLVHFPMRRLQALSPNSYNDLSPNQVKRARVENIIKSMSGSLGANFSEGMGNQQEVIKDTGKNATFYQDQIEMLAMHQLQSQYQHVRQVKNEVANRLEEIVESRCREPSPLSKSSITDVYNEVRPLNYSQHKAGKVKLMADVLKCELSNAVSKSVDSIFKSTPISQTKQVGSESQLNPLQGPFCQTEALSLVVQKKKDDTDLQPRCELKLNQKSSTYIDGGQPKMIEKPWCAVKVRTKVNSRAERNWPSHTVDHTILDQLPRGKSLPQSSSLVKNMYTLNEGLTTNHLKKAKLMFFYTRYPSSLVLKTCFFDVQFNRCITSQLIKWFSNFREFFYIQMEKFARHAVLEGATDERDVTVGRESELFRVLNLHYNKTSSFQVPDRFLEVAEITLREFYLAICLGKDCDPSWKKTIYRVICKLDSDVPALFKTPQSK